MTETRRRLLRTAWVVGLALVVAAAVRSPTDRAATGPRPTIYLTFDADMTPGMLKRLHAGEVSSWFDAAIAEYLRDNHLHAAVFVSGLFAEAYPEVVAGFAHDPLFIVGVHGYRHAAFTANCYGLPALHTDAEKRDDISRARDAIARVTGRTPTLFRYPGLCHDAHDDALVRREGLTVDVPDVISGDSFSHDVDAIVHQVLRHAKDGRTVIFHLGGPNAPATLAALKIVVAELKKKGYEFGAK